MFYVVPLLLAALVAWIERGLPRGRWAAATALVAVLAPLALPYPSLIGTQSEADTLMADAWWWLVDKGLPAGDLRYVVLGGALAFGAAALAVPRRVALLLPAALLVYFGVTTLAVENGAVGVHHASLGALFQGIGRPDRDWVDAAAGRNADVAALHVDPRNRDAFAIWENEFFSRSVGTVYDVGIGPLPGGLPETPLTVDRANGLLLDRGRPVRHAYALTTSGYPLIGFVVARDTVRAVTLYRPRGPLRVAYATTGIYADTWSGPRATWRGYACTGGALRVRVQQDRTLFPGPQTVRAEGRSFVVRGERWITVPLHAANGRCDVAFTVAPTKVPGPQDRRRLGVHFLQFRRAT